LGTRHLLDVGVDRAGFIGDSEALPNRKIRSTKNPAAGKPTM